MSELEAGGLLFPWIRQLPAALLHWLPRMFRTSFGITAASKLWDRLIPSWKQASRAAVAQQLCWVARVWVQHLCWVAPRRGCSLLQKGTTEDRA